MSFTRCRIQILATLKDRLQIKRNTLIHNWREYKPLPFVLRNTDRRMERFRQITSNIQFLNDNHLYTESDGMTEAAIALYICLSNTRGFSLRVISSGDNILGVPRYPRKSAQRLYKLPYDTLQLVFTYPSCTQLLTQMYNEALTGGELLSSLQTICIPTTKERLYFLFEDLETNCPDQR
ncbi:hypothetical protein PHYBLDRAFT_141573 [Phycomyces blakesleeanus NRRL 1555(-)]|uniref:Uncharacterized protein n=1 Tax=Phycomyces blakesleeanus (strain ATCC 8743b / DSM 1359 / FGSC 10004 / NBRC 33097 / NRRL 1555) TaxID=763407 RepID=A0A167PDG1_PHYB8|nr:hypothetical protein PHYBLDRAFT_141573 [Phycomyces blakesleeanus NRRL 1555(-)]OAD77708.1 hypothetical protein PHYBLDRAFT_141573 [Phycomyces blakesleeanus NRRL 1555(-)]|eukprot:XP_018295748.1 hypothetical protein PHYBLDRAFT_141573 [Phycomyces blakesleeanus NRRL 1555(-)]